MTCKYFETCSAPICPQDQSSLDNGIWYPDEEICKSRKFATNKTIRTQKKITKKTTNPDDGYFTVSMLNQMTRIQNPKGLDPDGKENIEIKKWNKMRGQRVSENV